NLEKSGYKVKTFQYGKDLLEVFNKKKPDLIILDLMLPDMDGLDICRKVKKESNVPIIILSAKGEELDKVLGLELGADDYMVKPFGVKELVARVKSVLRRFKPNDFEEHLKEEFKFGSINLFIDEGKHQIFLDSRQVKLNPKEFRLVSVMLQKLNSLMSRQELIRNVWGEDYFGDTRTLDVHIRRIREKMSYKEFGKRFIQTVHGYGYKMVNKA
ncbi:MAG: response regulator transcription factor, partial [Actinomycetota bacterium]